MKFSAPLELAKNANIKKDEYSTLYEQSINDPNTFWGKLADEFISWDKKWDSVKNTSFDATNYKNKWFEGGKLNPCVNCLDRHLEQNGNKVAIIFEGDDPATSRKITYNELYKEVCKFSNALESLGVHEGDRVTIYMPMVIEAVVAMLACARIGAIHSVVFAGFSPTSLQGRINDSESKVVITADEGRRGGKTVPLKKNVDEAVEGTKVEKVIVFKNTSGNVPFNASKDVWWHELMANAGVEHSAKSFDSEHPLFILYTSGSTGKPKGLLHTTAGYLLYASVTFKYVFDYKENDVYWCSADVGWITGHSYIVYGPLSNCATIVLFEGVPSYPTFSRYWEIIDKHKVSIFYTSPTAIRMLMREGDSYVTKTARDSLRVLGSVGEPINPEAWEWYYKIVGKEKCAIVDTWWQTETGGHILTPLPGVTDTKPGSAASPFFGIKPVIIDGALCIADGWPGLARTIWGDHNRYLTTYFSTFPNHYFSGDAARVDEDGYYWISGRIDDVINVSGHRISTAEVEAAINEHSSVAESAVVGYPHEIKGEGIYAYVITYPNTVINDVLKAEITMNVKRIIGGFSVPDKIQFVSALPKTRSGKIMRRILRKIAAGEIKTKDDIQKLGDISTLLNPEVINELCGM